MGYRKDIQIVRGIAVILVVLFHFEVPGFASGFLGVDVFFVLSGYLMAVMYDPLNKQDFFIKRSRRLLPAYFATVLVTLGLAIFLTTPNDFQQVSIQSAFAAMFAPNLGYWLENSYFDKAAFKPLLHLWSLGVEVQFYLLIPALYWVFKKSKLCFSLIFLASAILCFVVVGISPKTSFFWMPLRLWEFLTGFCVAHLVLIRKIEPLGKSTWIGAIALFALVFIPAFKLDGTAAGFVQGHPGLVALMIVAATAAILAFGLPSSISSNPIAKLLEKTGDWSYSIYLAHFPVIVLFLYKPFSGTVLRIENLSQSIVLILLVIGTSALLFRYVETPFRTYRTRASWMIAPILAVFAVGQVGLVVQQAATPAKEMLIYQAWSDRDGYRCGKINRILEPKSVSCEVTKLITSPRHQILLVGNSHADSIKTSFSEAALAGNSTVFFWVDNNPLIQGGAAPPDLIAEAKARKADAIVLHFSPRSIDSQVVAKMVLLARENHIKLSFIMPVPVWEKHVPMMLWQNLKGREPVPTNNFLDYQEFNRHFIDDITKIVDDKFRVYQVAGVFCQVKCRLTSESGAPFYFDNGHLTLTGSRMLRGVFDQVIADLD